MEVYGLAFGCGSPRSNKVGWFCVNEFTYEEKYLPRPSLAYWKFESISLQERVSELSVPGRRSGPT